MWLPGRRLWAAKDAANSKTKGSLAQEVVKEAALDEAGWMWVSVGIWIFYFR